MTKRLINKIPDGVEVGKLPDGIPTRMLYRRQAGANDWAREYVLSECEVDGAAIIMTFATKKHMQSVQASLNGYSTGYSKFGGLPKNAKVRTRSEPASGGRWTLYVELYSES